MRSTPLFMIPLLALASACSSSGNGGSGSNQDIDPEIPCSTDNCGQSSFRHAVPSRETVRIQFGNSARRFIQNNSEVPAKSGIGSTRLALESLSPALVETQDHVDQINIFIDELFASFEELAATGPEVETDLVHIWRQSSEDDASLDEILVVTAIDGRHFAIELIIADGGDDPENGITVIQGEVALDENESKSDFELVIDLDAASSALGGLGATGEILLKAQPFAGGMREIWFDFDAVGPIGGELESSITTYWIFGADEGALEFLQDLHDEEATVFVRWDGTGGRYDHHVAWLSADYGLVDEIATNCWDGSGGELFDGFAMIDQSLSYYGEIDGLEDDCHFGPLEGHPNPSNDFENLPGEGEWQDLEFGAAMDCSDDPFAAGCPPLCEDEPNNISCVPWCDEDPSDPDCVEYCDWFDDPDFCS